MGQRGPAPSPAALKVLRGEKRPSHVNFNEPRPRDFGPTPPEWLHEYARAEWDRIAPDVAAMGVVKAVDEISLAAYCVAVARFRRINELLDQSAILLREPLRKNPLVAMARDASYELKVWAREFGFTPSARQPLRVEVSHAESPASRILTGT